MNKLRNISKLVEFEVEGTDRIVSLNLTDSGLLPRITAIPMKVDALKESIQADLEAVMNSEADDVEKGVKAANIQADFYKGLADLVDEAFQTNLVEQYFGVGIVPTEESLVELLELLTPYILGARDEAEAEQTNKLLIDYSLERIASRG